MNLRLVGTLLGERAGWVRRRDLGGVGGRALCAERKQHHHRHTGPTAAAAGSRVDAALTDSTET